MGPGTVAAVALAARLGQDLEQAIEALGQATVQLRLRGGALGAGVVWDERGLVVTNAHVARGEVATLEFADGRVAEASLVLRDPRQDLAALAFDRVPAGLVAAALRDTPAPRVGELVVALGHPGGHAGAVTVGIIHREELRGARAASRWIAADLRLAPGFSGGPLADSAGRVLGINTMIHGGLALAIPTRAIQRWLRGSRRLAAVLEAGVAVSSQTAS